MFEIIFGLVLLGFFFVFLLWLYVPALKGKLTTEEIDQLLGKINKTGSESNCL